MNTSNNTTSNKKMMNTNNNTMNDSYGTWNNKRTSITQTPIGMQWTSGT
jgi:hypothetical protein